MKLMEKILLATDFNEAANDAMQTAIILAKKFLSEIILIHIIPELEDISLPIDTIKANVKKMLENVKKHISDQGVTIPEPILLSGTAFHHITTYADIHNVNIIIIGEGESIDASKYRLGITACRIIRTSKKPVWIVKKGLPLQVKKIMCPVDFSNSSERALTNAIHLARKFEAELTVLYVVKPASSFYLKMTPVVKEEQKKWREFRISEFGKFLKKFDFYKVKWNKAIRDGNPAEGILSFISQFSPDLMVMGTIGRTGLDRLLIGSVAEKVTRELPCSTLLVKKEAPFHLKLDEKIAAIESFLKQGHELLETGFVPEAVEKFEYCIDHDVLFAPAWEGLAKAYDRLGRQKEYQKCLDQARHIRQQIWEKKVEFEIRKQMKKK
jgi:nucleotide-binding universal stress UspA family protein